MTKEQEIYNNIWNEIDKRIIAPKISREQLKTVITTILDDVTVIRYEVSGNSEDSLKLCGIFILDKSNQRQSFYEDFYNQLKDWYISEYAKVNPIFTRTEHFKGVIKMQRTSYKITNKGINYIINNKYFGAYNEDIITALAEFDTEEELMDWLNYNTESDLSFGNKPNDYSRRIVVIDPNVIFAFLTNPDVETEQDELEPQIRWHFRF